ncbi:enolase C-terminal domain-like protein [Plastorhodobacter daqingensis]|uniref:Enolase C-terminal domain-like protein n=1 Tax=Plastorhodobacter daqingensis TaxID=1387281 RepID=A0ABW2UPC2_9RHOB
MSLIERVEIHEYTFPIENLSPGRSYVPGARSDVSSLGIRIFTRDGLEGSYCPQHGGKKAHVGQLLMIAQSLIGRDALQRESIYDDLKRALRQVGFIGVSHVDIALWDLAARKYGVSVKELLGGFRTRLRTYASTTHGDEYGALTRPEDYADFAEACHALGFGAFKIHGWAEGEPKREAQNVLHLAAAVGDRMTLLLDPACQLRTFADALYVGRACDEAGYFWYEDPMRDGGVSIQAYKRLREKITTPLLLTEHVRGVEPKADWAVAGATDFLRADPDMDLGISGVMRIARLAEALGCDVELHGVGPAHRACMSAIRNTNFYELALVNPKARNPVPPIYRCGYSDHLEDVGADGCYPVPEGPGLGVEYDWDYIARRRTALHVFT